MRIRNSDTIFNYKNLIKMFYYFCKFIDQFDIPGAHMVRYRNNAEELRLHAEALVELVVREDMS